VKRTTNASRDSLRLADFIAGHPRLVALTGAGISRGSGIPTYRDDSGNWLPAQPIRHQAFLDDVQTRQRYWTRSWYGWPIMKAAAPNPAHFALAELERRGAISLLITQNVDGLHRRAGSRRVVELHGRVDRVRCLTCDTPHSRDEVQQMLGAANRFPAAPPRARRPDGDMDIADALGDAMTLPLCRDCSGDLMPDVVFFGGSVPTERVRQCKDAVAEADALLVVGSSLMVYSGYRFCRLARDLGKPLAIANPGVTRADAFATLRLYEPAETLLAAAVARTASPGTPVSASGRDNPS
jgi:NAD-dependent SIR2 family protein deacetylase